MRIAVATLLLTVAALSGPTHPPTEECAAMLISPSVEWRKAGQSAVAQGEGAEDAGADYRDKVLEHLAQWAHNRSAWIASLEAELETTSGARHIAIRQLLTILNDSGEDSIGVDVLLLDLPLADAQAILGKGLPTIAALASGTWGAWWSALQSSKQATLLFKTSLPGKESLDVIAERKRRISYVKDFVIDGNIGSPEVAELEVGTFLTWRPIVASNREYVTLHFDMKFVEIVRPISTREKQVGKLKAQIQVPELIDLEKRLSITLPLGGHGAFLVGQAPGSPEGNVTIALVRATTGSPRGIPDLPIEEREIGAGIDKSEPPK